MFYMLKLFFLGTKADFIQGGLNQIKCIRQSLKFSRKCFEICRIITNLYYCNRNYFLNWITFIYIYI